ncbi:PHB depolymerase family esterase [Jiangella anatolica]|uniref:Phospholipase n=1 Tax=Jiangella anatolica TaxID=2670374 RepID=A0A2W2CN91_9ACTN|nr:PHB depolymerase family esterase [Jiangella anatolica]PZF86666.1 phospholipase [Jiangella anatolica]
MQGSIILRAGLALALVAGGAAATGTAATAAPDGGRDVRAVDATVITEVTPVGYKVVAVAIEYDGIVRLGRTDVDEDAFDVAVTLARPGAEPRIGVRTVVDAYSTNAPEVAERQRPGRYIVLELDPADPLAAGAYNQTFTRFYDLTGAYEVRQVEDIVAPSQTLAADPQPVASSGVRNPIVDDYAAGSFAAPSGTTLPYRLFSPRTRPGRQYPLVVTLHGHGESGSDNFAQIAGNQISVAFAHPDRQARHPSFVLSPQAAQAAPGAGGWWRPEAQAAVVDLVRSTIAEHPEIDPSRVYLTGLSMGSYGSWALLPEHRGLFAGALLVCGAGDEAAAVATLGDLPIWALHSADDFIVRYDAPGSDFRIFTALEAAGLPVTWSEWPGTAPDAAQEANAADARARASAAGSRHLFTTFPASTTPLFSHGSWIPTYTNDTILDWLFEQRSPS